MSITLSNIDGFFHSTIEFLCTNFSRCFGILTFHAINVPIMWLDTAPHNSRWNLITNNVLIGTTSGLYFLMNAVVEHNVPHLNPFIEIVLRLFNSLAEECIREVVTCSQKTSIPVTYAMRGTNVPIFCLIYLLPTLNRGMELCNSIITIPLWRTFWFDDCVNAFF